MAVEERVQRGFDKQGLMSTLGATLMSAEAGTCSIKVDYSSRVTQQHGLFHGGVIATLADNAAGFASYTLMGPDEQPLTVEFKISYLAPAQGDVLEARAQVTRSGRRLKHVAVEVFAMGKVVEEVLVAMALATVASTKAVNETD